jgi:hypothetical protein
MMLMKGRRILISLLFACVSAPASAQWLNVRSVGIPRLPNGKPDLSAPAPRDADGKPMISGLWMPDPRYIGDIAHDLKDVPFQPWAKELYAQRRANNSKDDPTGRCMVGGVPRNDAVPYPFKIYQLPGATLILYEAVHSYRQIFSDGRELPKDPNPAWLGYSVGKWVGNDFVVTTSGFNDEVWLDNNGHPATNQLHVTERFRRKDFGHMDIEITIDDSKAYTKPWSITLPLTFLPDTELLEYMCNENNRDLDHLVGK